MWCCIFIRWTRKIRLCVFSLIWNRPIINFTRGHKINMAFLNLFRFMFHIINAFESKIALQKLAMSKLGNRRWNTVTVFCSRGKVCVSMITTLIDTHELVIYTDRLTLKVIQIKPKGQISPARSVSNLRLYNSKF